MLAVLGLGIESFILILWFLCLGPGVNGESKLRLARIIM